MTHKYKFQFQEALDYLQSNCQDSAEKQVEVIQELIDNFSRYDKALDRACNKLAHKLYYFDDEENYENHTNLASYQYLSKARHLKEQFLEEV